MKRLAIGLIRLYQRWLSPGLPVACRFQPTCSEYALEALDRHGLAGGVALTLLRIARCNPLGGSGYDPVPAQPERHELTYAGSAGSGQCVHPDGCGDNARQGPRCCPISN